MKYCLIQCMLFLFQNKVAWGSEKILFKIIKLRYFDEKKNLKGDVGARRQMHFRKQKKNSYKILQYKNTKEYILQYKVSHLE